MLNFNKIAKSFLFKMIFKFIDFFLESTKVKNIIIFLSIISLSYAFYIANTTGSVDFQYSPTFLFSEKTNPYEYFLHSPTREKILLGQAPVYSHFAYILLYPFTYFEWEIARLAWSISNILVGFLIVVFLCKKNYYNISDTLFILSLFFLSTPFRVCVGNGQITLLILASFCCIFIRNLNLKSLLLGLSYIKYSFSPILAFVIIFKYGFKYFFISCTLAFVGWIFFSIYLNQEILNTLFQPIQVGFAAFSYSLTTGDLFTILNNFFDNSYFSISVVIFFNLYISKKISKINNDLLFLSLISIINLMSFGHLIYDYIFLLPLLIYNFKNRSNVCSKVSILIIFYFFYGIKMIEFISFSIDEKSISQNIYFTIINFLLMCFLFSINYYNFNYFYKLNFTKKSKKIF